MRDLNALEMTLVSGGYFNGDGDGEDKPKEEEDQVVEDVIVVMGTAAGGGAGWHYGARAGAAIGAPFGPVGGVIGAAGGAAVGFCATDEDCREAVAEAASNAGDETAGRHMRSPHYVPVTPFP